jgi:hypothetical protein
MLFDFERKPAYFSVHALRDGTIWLALQGRKPSKRQNPQIDEDGIYQWMLDEENPIQFADWGKCLFHTAVATSLNMKRIVRKQVETKLDLILSRLDEIHQRLERLEAQSGRSAGNRQKGPIGKGK